MSTWLHRLRRWTWSDYALLCETFLVALFVEGALHTLSLRTMFRAIARRYRSRRLNEPARLDFDRLARFAAAPYRLCSRQGTCLRESLVLSVLLRRRGVPAEVSIGVRREGGLMAHAWVDIPGVETGVGLRYHELRGAWSD